MPLSEHEGQVQDAYLGEKREAKDRYDPNYYANKIAPKHRMGFLSGKHFSKRTVHRYFISSSHQAQSEVDKWYSCYTFDEVEAQNGYLTLGQLVLYCF